MNKNKQSNDLTVEELKIIINSLSQSQVRVIDAPVVIQLINKISKIIDEKEEKAKKEI